MKLQARTIQEFANPTTVFLSDVNCKKLAINPNDFDERCRFVQIQNGVNAIWQPLYVSTEAQENEILIPEQLAGNLPDLPGQPTVEIEQWSVEHANVITSITLEKMAPKERSLASKRSYLTNMVRNLSFPILPNFLLTIPVELANKEIVQAVFRVKTFEPSQSENVPAMLSQQVEPKVVVNLINLGTRDEDPDALKGFELVGGLAEQIRQVREVVELPFVLPEVFAKIGIRPAKGILLTGPPGTGKTSIAKAVSQTTKAKFIPLNASELFSEFAGKAEEHLRAIFEEAAQAERAIIFIDEIDALAVRRDRAQEDFARRLVGQFLPLLDGMEDDGRVVVIGATNRPEAIDPAFRRPGRFDREIIIGIPNEEARFEILEKKTRRMKLAHDVNLRLLAGLTHGYVGADLEAICREAGIHALNAVIHWESGQVSLAKDIAIQVNQEHFLTAIKGFVPSTLRDVESNIPTIDWERDIVGLQTEKKALLEAIEVPFRHSDKLIALEQVKQYSFCESLIIGVKGCGRKILVYALAKRLGLRCLEVNLLRLISRYNGEIEEAFHQLKQTVYASSPCILFLPSIDIEVAAIEATQTNRLIVALGNFFDEMESINHVYTILTAESERTVPSGLFQLGRIDHVIHVSPLPREEQKQLLQRYLPPQLKSEQINFFLENFGNLSSGELIYVASRCVLAMLSHGWDSKSEVEDSVLKEAVSSVKISVVGRSR